jgi:hypothetical protein
MLTFNYNVGSLCTPIENQPSLLVIIFSFICPTLGKGKVVPLRSIQAHVDERRYSSYNFLTSALEGGEWSASHPGLALPPGKEPPVPIVQEAVQPSDISN